MSFLAKTRTLSQLTMWQWLWLVEAYCRLVWVCFCLRKKSTNWLNAKLQAKGQEELLKGHKQNDELLRMHEAVRLAARCHFYQPACLQKSIVLMDMLCSRGCPANVVIGVDKQNNKLLSHAWVELNGKSIGEKETLRQQFEALEKLK